MLEEKLGARPSDEEVGHFVRDSMSSLAEAINRGTVALTEAALEHELFNVIVPQALKRAQHDLDQPIHAVRKVRDRSKRRAKKLIDGTGEDPLALLNETDSEIIKQIRRGKFPNWTNEGALQAYYLTILNRGASRVVRDAQRDRKHQTPWTDNIDELVRASRNADEWYDPTAAAALTNCMWHKLEALSPADRTLLVYLYQGCTPSDIAARLGVHRNTANRRIKKAQRRAQELLGPAS